MRAILKNVYSPDIDVPLSDFFPASPDNFGFLARLIVGDGNMSGEETFDVMVCTPQWLSANHKVSDIVIGRHYIIVFEYNYLRIFSKIKSIVEGTQADSWEEIGLIIGRLGKWEFEDYRE